MVPGRYEPDGDKGRFFPQRSPRAETGRGERGRGGKRGKITSRTGKEAGEGPERPLVGGRARAGAVIAARVFAGDSGQFPLELQEA